MYVWPDVFVSQSSGVCQSNVSGDLSKWTVGSVDCARKSSEQTVNVN